MRTRKFSPDLWQNLVTQPITLAIGVSLPLFGQGQLFYGFLSLAGGITASALIAVILTYCEWAMRK